MRVIKKYAARRMYDVKESKFITLAKLANLITNGEEIQVIDNKTGNDITSTVLTQVILEQQRSGRGLSSMPSLLHTFIKRGSDSVVDFLERPISGSFELISLTEERAKEIIGRLTLPMGERDNLLKRVLARIGERKKVLETFVRGTIARMNIPTRRELEKLEKEVERLKKQIATTT
jgi:polyhydroxyalkanoate synthesis repressor PhaR